MFSLSRQLLADLIIKALEQGPLLTTALIKRVRLTRSKASKQGIYRALRLLKKAEVVVIHHQTVSLNLAWLNQLRDFAEVAQAHYRGLSSFSTLKNGEKIKYIFNNLSLTDAFWNHAIYILLKVAPPKEHWFSYNPHAWFFLVRPAEELALMKFINQDRKYLLTVGGNTMMDKFPLKKFDNNKSQYCLLSKPLFLDNSYYLNILGDFMIEVYFDKKIALAIEQWYQQTTPVTSAKIAELAKIINTPAKTKLVISRNAKKAEKLKQRLRKNFYLGKIII